MHGEGLSKGGVDAVVPRTTIVAFSPCRPDVGSTPNTRSPCLWLACPIPLGRSVISRGDAHLTGVLHAGVAGQVEDGLTVLLEDLAGQYSSGCKRFSAAAMRRRGKASAPRPKRARKAPSIICPP